MAVPSPSNKVEFQEYGEEYISTLAGHHYFTGNETDEEEVLAAKMRAEWGKLKFDVYEWKAKVPKDVKDGKRPSKITTTTWTLRYQDKKPPDKTPPDINPRTKTPQRKLMNTKYILHK